MSANGNISTLLGFDNDFEISSKYYLRFRTVAIDFPGGKRSRNKKIRGQFNILRWKPINKPDKRFCFDLILTFARCFSEFVSYFIS